MQAATLHRVASRLGIVASPAWPLTTLVIPIVEEAVLDGGVLHAYRDDAERVEDLQEFRSLVNAIADDYLPENESTDNEELAMPDKESEQSQLCALKQELQAKELRIDRLERVVALLVAKADLGDGRSVRLLPINDDDREYLNEVIPY